MQNIFDTISDETFALAQIEEKRKVSDFFQGKIFVRENGKLCNFWGKSVTLGKFETALAVLSASGYINSEVEMGFPEKISYNGKPYLMWKISRAIVDALANVRISSGKLPQKVYLVSHDTIVYSRTISPGEEDILLFPEPILSVALPFAETRVYFEYEDYPQDIPVLNCETYVFCNSLRSKMGEAPILSQEYSLYYMEGVAANNEMIKKKFPEFVSFSRVREHVVSSFSVQVETDTNLIKIQNMNGCYFSDIQSDEKYLVDELASHAPSEILFQPFHRHTLSRTTHDTKWIVSYRVNRIDPEFFSSLQGKTVYQVGPKYVYIYKNGVMTRVERA